MHRTATIKSNSKSKETQLKKTSHSRTINVFYSPVNRVLQLQRTYGNQATQTILRNVFSTNSTDVIQNSLIQRVKERKKGDSLSSGVVKITQDNHTMYLCSQDKADELQQSHKNAARFDLRYGLDDAIPDPNKYQDVLNYMTFIGAEIGKAFTQTDTIIINCKSGKTRTPTIAIIYEFLRTGDMKGAIDTIANQFKTQRPGVGIDYDSKLTGARILDERGTITTSAPKLNEISKAFGSMLSKEKPTDFPSIAERIFSQSQKKKRGSRYSTGWKAWEKGKIKTGPPRGISKNRKKMHSRGRRISPREVRELLTMARNWGYI